MLCGLFHCKSKLVSTCETQSQKRRVMIWISCCHPRRWLSLDKVTCQARALPGSTGLKALQGIWASLPMLLSGEGEGEMRHQPGRREQAGIGKTKGKEQSGEGCWGGSGREPRRCGRQKSSGKVSWLQAGWEASVCNAKLACPASCPQFRQRTLCAAVFIVCKTGMVILVFHFVKHFEILRWKRNILLAHGTEEKLSTWEGLLLGVQISSFGFGTGKAIICLLLRPRQWNL